MPDMRYKKFQALIVDDFDSFRDILFAMLQTLGIPKIDIAASRNDALRLCEKNTYDLILCDQNLGRGKSGQQVLEVLGHTTSQNSDSLFVLISAESNKNIIMAAFNHEPDDYLAKPITNHTLEQRLNRLLTQRLALAPIYRSLKQLDMDQAIELCQQEIISNPRYKNHCQKMLGKLLLKTGRLAEAEQLYCDVLDLRQLDWAMLGMAHVKKLHGDSLSAEQWLDSVIEFNPLCLKAYDLLADILQERDDNEGLQILLQKALALSPLSSLRQQALGDVALKNIDVVTAANAYRRAVKLGENSLYDNINYVVKFVHSVIQRALLDRNSAQFMMREAIKYVVDLPLRFGKCIDIKVRSYLLEAQLHVVNGEAKKSQDAVSSANIIMTEEQQALTLSTKIEWINALRALNKIGEAEKVTVELLARYADSEHDLQQIDPILDEPRSVKNRALIASVNREGVGYYNTQDFARSMLAFKRAIQKLPKHIGLQLNLLQTFIAQFKAENNLVASTEAQQIVYCVEAVIPATHEQYHRFRKLEAALKNATTGADDKFDRSTYDQVLL